MKPDTSLSESIMAEADAQKQQIKETVRKLFAKKAERDELQAKLEELNRELAEYGLADNVSTVKVPRATYPELTIESITEFIKGAGGSGRKTGKSYTYLYYSLVGS